MRIVSFTFQNHKRLGIYLDHSILDIYFATEYYPLSDIVIHQVLPCVKSFDTLINSPQEIRNVLHKLVDYYSSDIFQQKQYLWDKNILIPFDKANLLPPLQNPGKIICVASNYPASSNPKKPDYPTIFLKPANTITGPDTFVLIYEMTRAVKCEVELAVVIGKKAHMISEENVDKYIYGLTIANDLGDQILENRTSQWTSGKMFDTFTPIGPWIVTLDEVPLNTNMKLSTSINNHLVQNGETSQMLFKIPEVIRILSTLTTLYPGDLILTGSPKLLDKEPNPSCFLVSGDKVTTRIEGLGQLTNIIKKEV